MPSAIDPTKPVIGNPTTQSVRDNFQAAKAEIEALQTATTDLTFAGVLSSFAGNLIVNGLTQIDDAITLTKAPGDSSLAIASTAYVDLALDVHEAAADPHPGIYLTWVAADGLYDPLGAALQVDNNLTTHINAVDAHPLYLTVPEADVLYDVIGSANTVNNVLSAHTADVDIHFIDAPANNGVYSRQNNAWILDSGAGIGEAPIDGTPYNRQNAGWLSVPNGMVAIEQGTQVGGTALNFNLDNTKFRSYFLDIERWFNVTNSVNILIRTGIIPNGPDFGVSDYDYVGYTSSVSGTITPTAAPASNSIVCASSVDFNRPTSMQIHLANPADGQIETPVSVISRYNNTITPGLEQRTLLGSRLDNVNPVVFLQVLPASGTINAVAYTLYGLPIL